jgi:hypothetical protein
MSRPSSRIARACDDLLDFVVLAFAAWTAVYHGCLVLDLGAIWAAAAGACALPACAWLAVRRSASEVGAARDGGSPLRRAAALRAACIAAAAGAGALFAFTGAPWWLVWALAAAAAGGAVALTWSRSGGDAGARPDAAIALAWAGGLAVLSLFLVRADGDDAHYVHLAAWVAAHGEFPVRDVLFTDQALPAIFSPPLSSFEALAGTLARGTGIAAPDLVYLVVAPLASALAVLATWRLLRCWAVAPVGVALSVAMLFLLWDADGHKTLGNLFVGRMWQGKVVFLAVLVPLLFVLLHDYAERPTRRALALLAAAGAAGVGLTTTGVFVVPVVAAGALAPLAVRLPRRAAAGFAAAAAYPLAGAAVGLIAGTRNAQEYVAAEVVPDRLVHMVLGEGPLALIALAAALAGPLLIRRVRAAQMTASTALLVACLLAPGVPLLIFELTGLGQVLWRLIWAIPIAALVGVAGAAAITRARPVGALAAAGLCAAIVVWGAPVWSPEGARGIASEPAWKRTSESVAAARRILARARPGDAILAPAPVGETLLVMSGRVTAVAPRPFYASALIGVPGGHAQERLLLLAFAQRGLGPIEGDPRAYRRLEDHIVGAPEVRRALTTVGVDIACVGGRAADAVLRDAGFGPRWWAGTMRCRRA